MGKTGISRFFATQCKAGERTTLHRLLILGETLAKPHLRIKAFFGYHEIDFTEAQIVLKNTVHIF